MFAIDWIAVLCATVAAFVLGGLWYSPLLLGKPWQRLCGLSDDDLRGGAAKVFGIAFLMELIIAIGLDAFIGATAGIMEGLHIGLMASLCWIAPMIIVIGLFERRPLLLSIINAGYAVLSLCVMGLIIAAF